MGKAVLSEKGGSIFLAIFGVPFFAVGVLVLYFMVFSPYLTLKDSQNWPQVNARIVDLKFSLDSKTKEVKEHLSIEYEYDYEGKVYKSIDLYIDTNSPGSLTEKEIYPPLKKAVDSGSNISAYANPSFPEQAVLYRELKDDLIMMIIFGGVFSLTGFGVIFGGILMYKSVVTKESFRKEHPNEPWMWNKTWRQGISKPERKSNLIAGFVFLCFWFGMTGISALALSEELLEGGFMSYFVGGMAAFGLLFVYFYIKSIFKYRKFGQSYLELKTLPGRLGQEFQGEIYAPFFLRPEGDIYFSVDCKRHYSEGRGDSRRSKTDELYKDKFTIDPKEARSLQEALVIPVNFNIPEDKPSSSDSIFWTLNVYAATTGLDWSEAYRIPVYK